MADIPQRVMHSEDIISLEVPSRFQIIIRPSVRIIGVPRRLLSSPDLTQITGSPAGTVDTALLMPLQSCFHCEYCSTNLGE